MNETNLSKDRLSRLHDVLAGHVDRGTAPGLVSVVSRRGEVHIANAAFTSPRLPAIGADFLTGAYAAIDD